MPVFTVHMPFTAASQAGAADKSVFVRDGFHFWAFVLGPLWLLWRRLWVAAVVYLAAMVGLEIGLSRLHVGADIRLLVMLIIALLVGFEAASLWRWARSRGRWREIGVVVAPNRESAERRFFDHWTGNGSDRAETSAVLRSPPPVPGANAHQPDVIGLFPYPGGRT